MAESFASISRYGAPRTQYDIFLSFRGTDTRKNFTSHLYKTLNDKGIRTFVDNSILGKGEEVSPSLIKAIRESQISIIIFSENYASSTYCLDELVEILECKKLFGRLVWPVFLRVEPSEVRQQKGNFGKALAKYEGSSYMNKEKLAKWKYALTEASRLSGWHLGDGYESQLIQSIVEAAEAELRKISRRVPLHVAKYPVGIEDRLQELETLIDVGTGKNDVKFIGIYGIDGVGKTTIAEAFFNKFADEFEGSSFLANVRATSKHNLGFIQLQGKLLFDILGDKNLKVGNTHRGINIIRQMLCFKRVLVVLDDVHELDQLKTLAGGHEWFGLGSRIIVTTRYKDLLTTHGVDGMYEVRALDHCRAIELFSWSAFMRDKPLKDYLTVSDRIVRHVSGLPLALELLGSFLRGRRKHEWESALHSLKEKSNKNLYQILKRSYDALQQANEVFQDVQDGNLKDGHSFVWRGDTDDIKNVQEEVLDNGLQHLTELQRLHIVYWGQQTLHIQIYGAKIFQNWRGHGSFSYLIEVDLGYCKSCNCLPPLGQLPFLKKLHIQGFDRVERIGEEFYSTTDALSSSKPFKSLESLTFSHMSQWKEWSFMKSGVFSDLKQLTLDNCRKLKGTCFPSYLPSLHSLLISGCKKQVVASLSTDGLPSLSLLKIGHCKELESFPIGTLPANVETVKIMGCKGLVSLSEDGWPSKLKSLEITYCEKLLENSLWWNLRSVTSLTSLQIIDIDVVVDSFPEEWQFPITLKSLTLRHFRNLKSLNGKALQHHTSLQELKIELCHHLQYLPEEGLPDSLSQLEIFGCGFLKRRCQKDTGEDWPKISHIPRIRIDCKDI